MEQKLLNKLLGTFENLTGFFSVIQSDHAYIHKGYGLSTILDIGSISAAYYVGFKTPSVASNLYVHWRPAGIQTSTNYITLKLYEDNAFSGGTDVTPFNRNRNLQTANPTNMQAFSVGVTASPTGDVRQILGIGAAGNPRSRSGGGANADEELVLLPNTDYIVEIDPDGATVVTGELFWYEEIYTTS